jgi:hypothetical protein
MNSITMRRTVIGFARISFLLLFAAFAGVSKAPAQIAVGISITVAPPVLPVYDQPPIPAPGYIWTPGYWAWDDGDYYWVPGTWVEAPAVGLLWTPGYWGCNDAGIYVWNAGYWGPHVGFYGGVNYGFGYGGVGYGGGVWVGGAFRYNTVVNNFGGVHITNVYTNRTVINNTTVVNRVSFNGGSGGLTVRPNAAELAAANDRHTAATSAQTQHQQAASTNRDLRASVNGGSPKVAAVSHAGKFEGAGVVGSHSGAGHTDHTGPAGHTVTGTGHTVTGTGHTVTGTGHTVTGTGHTVTGTGQHLSTTGGHSPTGASVQHSTGRQQGSSLQAGTPRPNIGGPTGGFRGGQQGQPRPMVAATNARPGGVPRGPAPRGPAPRGPAPRGPAPHGPVQHHP